MASDKYGLYLNVGKTKILSNVPLSSFNVDGVEIEVVHSFNFLGSTISEDGDCSKVRKATGNHLSNIFVQDKDYIVGVVKA